MKIQCPQCAVIGLVDDSYRGKKVKCPKCYDIFTVSDGLQAGMAVPPDPASPALSQAEPKPIAASNGEPPGTASESILVDRSLLDEAEILPATEINSKELLEDQAVDQTLPAPTDSLSATSLPEVDATIDWSDIVSEMDKERDTEETRGREENFAPAGLDQGAVPPASPPEMTLGEELEDDRRAEKGIAADSSVESEQGLPGLDVPPAAAAAAVGVAALSGTDGPPEPSGKIVLDGVEQHPYGMEKEQCWQCGKRDSVGMPFIAKDGRLYCPDCLPAEAPEPAKEAASPRQSHYGFTIGGLLREAWAKTKGVKGAIWAGSAIMYLAMIIIVAGGALLLPQGGNTAWNPAGMAVDILFQLLTNAVMMVFSAGLINIGIHKVAGESVGWRMVFDGFPVAGNLIVAGILQTLR